MSTDSRDPGDSGEPGRSREPGQTRDSGAADSAGARAERLRALLVVGLGGAAGTLLRAGLAQPWPHDPAGVPGATLTVNLVGAFLLGAITGFLAGLGPDTGQRRLVRLAVGTGFMGGLTTHSTYVLETAHLVGIGYYGPALDYLAGSLVVGLGLAATGLFLGGRLGERVGRRSRAGRAVRADRVAAGSADGTEEDS